MGSPLKACQSVIAMIIVIGSALPAKAADAKIQLPPVLKVASIRFDEPTLPPLAYSRFCLQYKEDCEVRRMAFRRPQPEQLSKSRLKDVVDVNEGVNRDIAPRADDGTLLGEQWRISPSSGACHDYAVTKRHELLARGWPSRALLLAEVIVSGGQHHLVLVVRTDRGDLVLDSLTSDIRQWTHTPYQWVRIQSTGNPNFWSTIAHSAV
jgi:predicted transglutaminase-like cysteine proteinase